MDWVQLGCQERDWGVGEGIAGHGVELKNDIENRSRDTRKTRNRADDAIHAEFLKNMSASADVLAMAKVEVDLNAIPEGKNVSGPPSLPWGAGQWMADARDIHRLSSSGEESPSSSATVPPRRSRRPTRSTLRH